MSFFKFIIKDRYNIFFLIAGIIIAAVYFSLLRFMFPVGSYFYDSEAYIETAYLGLKASWRPLGYSNFLNFFHCFSRSDGSVIFVQYLSNVIANLFLFFTLRYFFPLRKNYSVILFILFMCNPLYVLYCNYILSDAFYCSLSVMWFTIMIWVILKPHWIHFIIQLVLLYWMFDLRYNGIVSVLCFIVPYIFSRQALWKTALYIGVTTVMMIIIVYTTTRDVKEATGVDTFSAYSGWQLASNAIFVLKHEKLDTSLFDTKTSKEICLYIEHDFDSLKATSKFKIDTEVNNNYIWRPGALQQYAYHYFAQFYKQNQLEKTAGNNFVVFNRALAAWKSDKQPIYHEKQNQPYYDIELWTAAGPVFKEFGTEVIKKYPLDYLRYFVLPNIPLYFHPHVELYNYYNNSWYVTRNRDTLGPIELHFFNYPSHKIDYTYANVFPTLMGSWDSFFTIINFLFLQFVILYYIMRLYKHDEKFNKCLIFYLLYYALYLVFSVTVVPNLFRYDINIVTLTIPFIVYLFDRLINKRNSGESAAKP